MAMKKNHIFKRITAATLAVMTAFMLLPAGGGGGGRKIRLRC